MEKRTQLTDIEISNALKILYTKAFYQEGVSECPRCKKRHEALIWMKMHNPTYIGGELVLGYALCVNLKGVILYTAEAND